MIKNIKYSILSLALISTTTYADTLYENASDGNTKGWHIYDNHPHGTKIENVKDTHRGRVIKVTGTTSNGVDFLGWKDKNHILQWKMKADKWNSFYIVIQTTKGFRYLTYSPRDKDKGIDSRRKFKIKFGLKSKMQDGKWHTFTRNIKVDLKQFEPNNNFLYIRGIKFHGSASFDDIKTLSNESNKKVIVLKKLKAFPTAEGAGAKASGGRFGDVIYVTNRKAIGKGSLKWALEQTGKRTIVFAIGGRFNIDNGITLGDKNSTRNRNSYKYSNFTLAGQTANDKGGVHLAHSAKRDSDARLQRKGEGASHFNVYSQKNMILRYFDSRYNWNWFKKWGKYGKEPTLRFKAVNDLIIDHISSGWSSYGLIILSNSHRKGENTLENITIQRSLMHENIVSPTKNVIVKRYQKEYQKNHNVGMLLGKDPLGNHGNTMTTAQWNDMGEFSILKNAFIGESHRFPNTSGGKNAKFRIINNYVYGFKGDNTGERLGRFAGTAQNDLIANVYQLRPYLNHKNSSMNFTSKNLYGYLTKETPNHKTSKANFYVKNNLFLKEDGTKHIITEDIKSNPYLMLFNYTNSKVSHSSRKHLTSKNAILRKNPIPNGNYPISILPASKVKKNLLNNVGGNVKFRNNGSSYIDDNIDKKYIRWAKNNTKATFFTKHFEDKGIGDSSTFNYPSNYNDNTTEEINPKTFDDDLDGMPDTWEKLHHLPIHTKNHKSVHKKKKWLFGDYVVYNHAGYTDLEMYLADIAGDFHMLAKKQ